MTTRRNSGFKSTGYIRPWKVGEPLKASKLDRMARNINANTTAISGPRQLGAKEQSDAASITDFEFNETDRSEETVQLVDDNGDISEVSQMTQVTMQNADGTILILNFTNP